MLLTAALFEDKTIGFGGSSSKLVEAYCIILQEDTADTLFKNLLEHAALPGQLYALCGLYFTDPSFFRLVVQEYRHDTRHVEVQFGCIITTMPVSSLIEAANPIVVDAADRDKSLSDWITLNTKLYTEWTHRKKKGKGGRPPSYELDIFNGGYPVWFKCK
jgi:hypothetical protein